MADGKLYKDVFISYSRKDKAFVRAIHRALKLCKRDTWVDWQSIPLTADWWQEICKGIQNAHTFVFIVSPSSLASIVCHLEIAQARSLNKRIVPILRQDIDFDEVLLSLVKNRPNDYTLKLIGDREILALARDNWRELQRPNWSYLRKNDDFRNGFEKLIEAILADLPYIEAHTRLLTRAREWETKGHDTSLLLRGNDLEEAAHWLVSGAAKQPQPTELHGEYISTSRAAEQRRGRRLLGGVSTALAVTLLLALLSFSLFRQSEDRRIESEQRGTAVAQQAGTATVAQGAAQSNAATATIALGQAEQRGTAVANQVVIAQNNAATAIAAQATTARRAEEIESIAWSSQARDLWNKGHGSTALTLALQASNIRIPPIAVRQTLYNVAYSMGIRHEIVPPYDVQKHMAFSPNDKHLLSYSKSKGGFLWNIQNGELVTTFSGIGGTAVFSRNGRWISTCCSGLLAIWDTETGTQQELATNLTVLGMGFGPNDKVLYVIPYDENNQLYVLILDVPTGHEQRRIPIDAACKELYGTQVIFSPNASKAMLACEDNESGYMSIFMIDTALGTIKKFYIGYPFESMAFSSDSHLALVASGYHVNLIDAERGEFINRVLTNTQPAYVAFLSDDRTAMISTFDELLEFWDIQSGRLLQRLTNVINSTSMVMSADGRQMINQYPVSQKTWLWDLYNGSEKWSTTIEPIYAPLSFSVDSKFIRTGNDNNEVRCWEVTDGQPLADCDFSIEAEEDNNSSFHVQACEGFDDVVFTAQRDYGICIKEDKDTANSVFQLFATSDNRIIKLLEVDPRDSYSKGRPSFTPDGKMFITASVHESEVLHASESFLRVWDTLSGNLMYEIQMNYAKIMAFTISPDGKTIASAYCVTKSSSTCSQEKIILWRIDTFDNLIKWTYQNRYVPELTCEERLAYRVEPYCDNNGMYPTRTPYPAT
jgi:WD40 repeat protein